MSSTFWGRLPSLGQVFLGFVRGAGAVQRARTALATRLRRVAPFLQEGFAAYCGLLVLLGMVTAGFVLFPVGLVLLLQGLLRERADQGILAGVLLSGVGLFYLAVPAVLIRLASRAVWRRLQDHTDQLADRVEGKG